jgi:hypothetical protein
VAIVKVNNCDYEVHQIHVVSGHRKKFELPTFEAEQEKKAITKVVIWYGLCNDECLK